MAKKQAGHHGGAWKVAYADFVTAMMALFMVLWISAQDKKILIATARYFQTPFRSPLVANSGVMPYAKQENEKSTSSDDSTSGQNAPSNQDKQIQLAFLNSVAADFYRLLHLDEDLDQKPVDIQITSDGLRVILFDRARKPLFKDSTSQLTPWGLFVMQNLAWIIDRHHFHVTIAGHTRSHMMFAQPDYGAWELSADRANSARRSLVHFAVDPSLIERVTGYADTRPLAHEPPDSPSNQRITLSLTFVAGESERQFDAAQATSANVLNTARATADAHGGTSGLSAIASQLSQPSQPTGP
ncbi:MAG: flagellar motor protein MotB [Terracidiphilus sp.]